MSHPTVAQHTDSTSRETAQAGSHPVLPQAQEVMETGLLLEAAPGPHLALREATCSMSQPRLWMQTLCWLASRRAVASAAHFTVLVTEATRGLKYQP